jgi:predicted nucleic acid-binding protein
MNVKPFFDTNILIYAFGEDEKRSEVARILLATGGVISIQVLNEFVAVLKRKLKFTWPEIAEALAAVRTLCPKIGELTIATHEAAMKIAERYGYQIFDSLIIASAHEAKCKVLYSEDLHDGQEIDGLMIRNPFTKSAAVD